MVSIFLLYDYNVDVYKVHKVLKFEISQTTIMLAFDGINWKSHPSFLFYLIMINHVTRQIAMGLQKT